MALAGPVLRGAVCADWLFDLGASLQAANCALAEGVYAGHLAGDDLDRRIVSLEQSIVERSLECVRVSRAATYRDVVHALDALINDRVRIPALYVSPAVNWYRRVLTDVRREQGAPIEFARQRHRERIGMALIDALQCGAPRRSGRAAHHGRREDRSPVSGWRL
jgi:hypothetical protein